MVASFAHWLNSTYAELAAHTYEWLANPNVELTLSASIALAPVTNVSASANFIITAELQAYANQFSYLYDKTYEMGLLRRIEFVQGKDLDNIWGKIYEVKRLYQESDDNYRKRLQVYLLQLTGSGTKRAIENIISIIVERPSSCRVDSYPGFCRIYLIDGRSRIKARERLDLINLVLPDTLAAGIDYRFYNPYHDLPAYMALHGPVLSGLPADVALQDTAKLSLDAHLNLAARSSVLLDMDIVLATSPQTPLKAYMALKDRVDSELVAHEALSASIQNPLDASEALCGEYDLTLKAYERLQAEAMLDLNADIALQANRLRPLEARMMLEA